VAQAKVDARSPYLGGLLGRVDFLDEDFHRWHFLAAAAEQFGDEDAAVRRRNRGNDASREHAAPRSVRLRWQGRRLVENAARALVERFSRWRGGRAASGTLEKLRPTTRSRSRICRDSAGCVSSSRSAARPKLRASTTAQ
jgi:hypothetical protein